MPEKKENQQHSTKTSRRSFFNKLWIFLGFVALAECISVVGAFLLPKKRRIKAGNSATIIEAGPVEKFPLDSVTAFIRGKFYLARLQDGGFLALSRKCTHLGCTIPWVTEEKNFACPCHSSAFDIRGEVISAPAPRALDIYHVFIENNVLKVDVGKKIKRTEFRAEQVTYPKSI
ncbi:MAG: ubiquinol-cytochrome c reductase iron-sulfur subunit [Desulfobacterales bacterium]|nr:MAG: ubiquinol-cytochrome c reductase iron-sulfur subunit [Desulfobacterales bacterium]UCD91268.1 MAG: ubiquinol-cytochrome c reductase iron-sulfur subunit [Desulfobacterales bacterium]